ncbi:MAG: extracellular solute-binding protein [Spirochaetales bacterium]|nr:extracellular solute-binding protein [Spirochaetales bacterium]
MKRTIVLCLVVILSAAHLFAAGSEEEGAEAPVELLWWSHYGPGTAAGDYMEVYRQQFEAQYPNITVELNNDAHETYIQSLPTAIASGEAPDVFAQTYRYIPTYHENGSLAPVGQVALQEFGAASIAEFEQQWAPNVLDAYRVGDNRYGLPFEYNIYAWGINTRHFREAGLDPVADAPKTWDDVIRVGKLLVQTDGGRITREAVAFPFDLSAAWYLLEFEHMVRELGGSVMNADQSECIVNSEAGIRAMQELKRRFDEGISDPDLSSISDYHNTAFPNGEFSMGIMGNWGQQRWYNTENFPGNSPGDFMAIPTPTFAGKEPATSTTGWAWVVFGDTDLEAEAWRLAHFLTSFPSENLIEVGSIVPRAGWSTTEGAKSIPDADLFEDMLQYSAPLAAYTKYAEVSEPLKRMIQEVLLSGRDIRESLDKAKAEIDQAIKD